LENIDFFFKIQNIRGERILGPASIEFINKFMSALYRELFFEKEKKE